MPSRKRRIELSPEKRIEIFLECIEDLKKRPFITNGLHDLRLQIILDNETGKLKSTMKEPDIEHLRSFLTDFRKFILNGEPANIYRIFKTCMKHLRKDRFELIENLKEMKCNWKNQYENGFMRIEEDGIELTPEHVLDLWINGLIFHSDNPEKRQTLDKHLKQDVKSAALQLFYSLPILTETILNVGALVSKAYHQKAFEF
jgi:hypothetical protein